MDMFQPGGADAKMAIVNCKRCGRIYNKVRRDICQACMAQEDEWFAKVKAYLHDHPGAMLPQISEATEIDATYIIDMIRNGRLMLSDYPNLFYECERCGNPTKSGRFCASCSKELTEGLSRAGQSAVGKKTDPKGYYSR